MHKFLFVALAALTISACGSATTATAPGSGDPATPAPTNVVLNACTLLPKDDATRITGIALQAGSAQSSTGHTECSYDRADSPDHLAVISVVLDYGSRQPHQFDFDRNFVISGQTPPVDVSGVGDKAFYMPDVKMLVVLKGIDLFHISVTDTTVADPQGVDAQAARVVLGNVH